MCSETVDPRGMLEVARSKWNDAAWSVGMRALAEETPVAFSYNSVGHAVMMATARDLEDFAIGFSITDGLIDHHRDIEELEIATVPGGIDVRLWLDDAMAARLARRRRTLAGPVGCGMCGLERLADALRPVPHVGRGRCVTPDDIHAAICALPFGQTLHRSTSGVHAAAYWSHDAPMLIREDVGRHNALDKLVGARLRAGDQLNDGMVLMTSRLSVELVQKAAMADICILVAVSAPTGLALRIAEQAGITIVGIARHDGFEVFCNAHRILGCA
jgi:FdhD protein